MNTIINKIIKLKELYVSELEDFKYVNDHNYFIYNKKCFIRYVSFNNVIHYGGFLFKIEKKNNTIIIFLINGSKKIWSFDFNKNYVFVNKVFSKNDKLRKIFEETLTKY